MKQVKLIITLGVFVVIVPFLGFPTVWKQGIFAFLGGLIIFSAYRVLVMFRQVAAPELEATTAIPDEGERVLSDESTEETMEEDFTEQEYHNTPDEEDARI